ncbi:MAG: hypothetical protein O2890_08435, partial [Cyanobacteria bacterium]|nr:hypothetical protein [Cyanobacteriota bacterium]
MTVAPNGQEIALSAPDGITFWKLDNTQQPRWLPASGEQVLMYGANGQSLMAISAGQVRFWEDVLPESSRNSYPAPHLVNSIISEPSANTRSTSFALSADRTVLVVALSDGRINLCRYGGYRSNRVKTLFHGGVVGTLHNPTALGAARPNPFSFVGKTVYTLELRVQPHLNASGSMLAKGSRIGLEYESSVANGRFLVAIGEHTTLDGGVYQSGRFTHLAVVVQEGLAPAIYQDGEPVKQEVWYRAFNNPNPPIPDEIAKTPLLIGGSITDNYPRERVWTSDQAILSEVPSFGGMILEVRIWNVARSQAQIRADQNRRLPLNWAKANGLVGYWRFEETQDNQIINLVGDGDYGMIVGAEAVPQTDVPQRFVSGLQFPSPSSEVNCGHDASLATPTAITVEAWVKHHFGDGWIVHRLDANKPGYALAWRDNKIRVILQSAKAVTIVDTQQPAPSDRAFHHIAFAWAQAFEEIQIYIDGRRQDTVSIKGDYEAILIDGQYRSTALFKDALATVETPLVIGKAFSPQAHRSWVMAEVRLWNVARTQNQIQFMMAKHIPQATPGLVGYWRLDDGGAIARNRVADWQGRSGPGH